MDKDTQIFHKRKLQTTNMKVRLNQLEPSCTGPKHKVYIYYCMFHFHFLIDDECVTASLCTKPLICLEAFYSFSYFHLDCRINMYTTGIGKRYINVQ